MRILAKRSYLEDLLRNVTKTRSRRDIVVDSWASMVRLHLP